MTRRLRRPLVAACALLAVLGIGCGGSSSFTGPALVFGGSETVLTLVVEPRSVSLEGIGDTAQLEATALDADGVPVANAPLAWSTSDVSIVTVSSNGLVTAQSSGGATVTVSSGGARASVAVRVVDPGT